MPRLILACSLLYKLYILCTGYVFLVLAAHALDTSPAHTCTEALQQQQISDSTH